MSAPAAQPLRTFLVKAYFNGDFSGPIEHLLDELEVVDAPLKYRLSVAVAEALRGKYKEEDAEWVSLHPNGRVSLGRPPVRARSRRKRKEDLRAQNQLLDHGHDGTLVCTVNWADSGPGIAWPETYLIFHLSDFGRYLVTATRDSTDILDCTDNLIGDLPDDRPALDAAKEVIQRWWKGSEVDWPQRWEYLFDEGMINSATANQWADEVWGTDDDFFDDEEDLDDDG